MVVVLAEMVKVLAEMVKVLAEMEALKKKISFLGRNGWPKWLSRSAGRAEMTSSIRELHDNRLSVGFIFKMQTLLQKNNYSKELGPNFNQRVSVSGEIQAKGFLFWVFLFFWGGGRVALI